VCRSQSADAEALLLAVQLADRLPPSLAARCVLLPPSGVSGVFDKAHLTALLPALLSGTSAHPRVHSVWTAFIKLLAVGSRTRESPLSAHAAVETFWDVACESSLFLSSHERKCVTRTLQVACAWARLTAACRFRPLRADSSASKCSPCCCRVCTRTTCPCSSRSSSCAAW
jgi:hypothetical protein